MTLGRQVLRATGKLSVSEKNHSGFSTTQRERRRITTSTLIPLVWPFVPSTLPTPLCTPPSRPSPVTHPCSPGVSWQYYSFTFEVVCIFFCVFLIPVKLHYKQEPDVPCLLSGNFP